MAASESDLTQRIDTLIERVTARNQKTQEAKKAGPTGWVVGLGLALVSLVGIGVVMWLASRRGRELAALQTKLEKDEIAQTRAQHEARKVTLLKQRQTILDELKKHETSLQERRKELFMAEAQHRIRIRKIEALTAWSELNDL